MTTLLETQPRTDLPAVLVRLSRECGVGLEHLRAEQLIREAQAAWPGPESARWSVWLREASECLSLRSRVVELSVDDALHLSQDGALLVGGYRADAGAQVLVGSDGNRAEFASGEIDERVRVSRSDLESQLGSSGGDQTMQWLVIEHPELSDADDARDLKHKPVRRLWRIVRPEWQDIKMVLVFAFFAGVLNLATPVAVEALVNTVAFGRLLQPILVLSVLLFTFLAFAAVMHAMQTYVAEIIQRRLFSRVAADLAYRLPRTNPAALGGKYGPELVNRFLDVVTLQKVVAQLLLDGVGIVLATLVGMAVLAFYHPWLLGFDVLLVLMIVSGLVVLGRGGVSTGIDESKMKYRLTSWFEDLMRCQGGFKMAGGAEFAVDRANKLTAEYLGARRQHFGILFRQITFILGLQAIAGTVLLGGGGWLVIQGEMSLGQLVAAELIVTTILTSLAKLGKHLEGFYDVVASVDKLGALFDLPVERHDGLLGARGDGGVDVTFTELRSHGTGWLADVGLSCSVSAGERVAVYGPAGSGKSMLARTLYGLECASAGHVEIAGSDPRDLRPDILRSSVSLVAETEIFEGHVADNVRLGRAGVSTTDVRAALDAVGLLDDVLHLPQGIETPLNASGAPLSSTQRSLLMIARAIVAGPQLLVIDGRLDCLPDVDLERIHAMLTDEDRRWTLVVTTGRRAIAERFDRTVRLVDEIELTTREEDR